MFSPDPTQSSINALPFLISEVTMSLPTLELNLQTGFHSHKVKMMRAAGQNWPRSSAGHAVLSVSQEGGSGKLVSH